MHLSVTELPKSIVACRIGDERGRLRFELTDRHEEVPRVGNGLLTCSREKGVIGSFERSRTRQDFYKWTHDLAEQSLISALQSCRNDAGVKRVCSYA